MSRYGEIVPVRSKEQEISGALLYPSYADERFTEIRTEGRTIFLAEGVVAVPGTFGDEYVDGAFYNYSDRIYQGYDHSLVERAREEAEAEAGSKYTAGYFEKMLQKIYEEPSTLLLHMITGVNRGNGNPFQVFGTVTGTATER